MAEIKLRDRNGNPLNFYGARYLDVPTPDDTAEVPYALYDPETLKPENLAAGVTIGDVTGTMETPESVETEVALDFSGGYMEVTPEEGKTFSKVTIPTPANLIPANIAEGVDIAGIIGTMAAGGDVKVASGTFTPSSQTVGIRISVDIGFVPDFLLVFPALSTWVSSWSTTAVGYLYFGLSSQLISKTNLSGRTRAAVGYSSGVVLQADTYGIDSDASTTTALIYAADETGFNLGTRKPLATTYNYLAIGGLT